MYFINQYIMNTSGTLTKAAYDRDTLYAAKAEFFRRQGDAINSSSTAWTMAMIIDEGGAVHMHDKTVKPVEPEAAPHPSSEVRRLS